MLNPPTLPEEIIFVEFEQRVEKAIQRFETEAPREVVGQFHAVRQAAKEGKWQIDEETGITSEWQWLLSLLLWGEYREQGEQVALEKLPYFFVMGFRFFLKQW